LKLFGEKNEEEKKNIGEVINGPFARPLKLLYEIAKYSLRGASFTAVTTTRAIVWRLIPTDKPTPIMKIQ